MIIDHETDEQTALLYEAAQAIKKHERLKAEMKAHEAQLSRICQEYSSAYRIWGFRPEHMKQACVARGLLS
jgi:hypothetical protein